VTTEVKLAGRLPGSIENNGMYNVQPDLLQSPKEHRLAVIWYDVPKIVDDVETGDRIPTMRVLRIEPMGEVGEATAALREMVMQAAEARTGNTPLPFDETDPNPVTVLDEGDDRDE
jgi:hypothetical protein